MTIISAVKTGKPFPRFDSDDAAAAFLETADLSEYDMSDMKPMTLAALDAAIARGIADADAGRVHDLDEVAVELDGELAAMTTATDSSNTSGD